MSGNNCAEVAKALRKFARDLERPIISGIRRGLSVARAYALADVRSGGLGAALWKKKGQPGVPPLVVGRARVKRVGNTYTGGLQEKGMAALIETGGRIQPHKITPRAGGSLLRFAARDGSVAFARVVQHPGAAVARHPHLERALQRAVPDIQREMAVGIEQSKAANGL